MLAVPFKRANWLIVSIVLVAVASWQVKRYVDARTQCYFFPNGEIDKSEVLNACVADDESRWKLPALVQGFGVLPFLVSSVNCSVDYSPNLFFIEKKYACKYFDEHRDQFLGLNQHGSNPLHELARRHGACRVDINPQECTASQIRSIDLLIESGIDLELKEYRSDTVLEIAAHEEDLDLVRALILRGADRNRVSARQDDRNIISRLLERELSCKEAQYNDHCAAKYRAIIDLLEGTGEPPD